MKKKRNQKKTVQYLICIYNTTQQFNDGNFANIWRLKSSSLKSVNINQPTNVHNVQILSFEYTEYRISSHRFYLVSILIKYLEFPHRKKNSKAWVFVFLFSIDFVWFFNNFVKKIHEL